MVIDGLISISGFGKVRGQLGNILLVHGYGGSTFPGGILSHP